MALLDRTHESVWNFGRALHQQLDIPEPPPLGSATPAYAHWFFNLNFLIQLQRRLDADVPAPIIAAGNDMRTAILHCVAVQFLPLPARLTLNTLGAWLQTAGVSGLGDNWCQLSPHPAASPMEMVRYASPELVLECDDGSHKSNYEVVAATNHLRKR
jgi:hypothetical protein